MSKPPERIQPNASRPSQKYLSLIIALVILLSLSVAAGFIFASRTLDSSEYWTFIGLLIFIPSLLVGIVALLILRSSRATGIINSDGSINWRKLPSENQRRKINSEIYDLALLLGVSEDHFSELRSAYIVAEDLAFRKIEQESNTSLIRHVGIETLEFDAVLVNENVIKCVEVTFLVMPDIPQEKINVMLRKADVAKRIFEKARPGTRVVLLLLLVTQFDQDFELQLRGTLAPKLSATPVDIDIRMLDFEDLQRIYASD
jgi:hypothetical protein